MEASVVLLKLELASFHIIMIFILCCEKLTFIFTSLDFRRKYLITKKDSCCCWFRLLFQNIKWKCGNILEIASIVAAWYSATGHEPATYISQTLIPPIINSTQKMRPYISPPDMLCGPEISYYNFYNRVTQGFCLIISFPLHNNIHEFFPSLIKFFEYLLDYGKHEWRTGFSGKV